MPKSRHTKLYALRDIAIIKITHTYKVLTEREQGEGAVGKTAQKTIKHSFIIE